MILNMTKNNHFPLANHAWYLLRLDFVFVSDIIILLEPISNMVIRVPMNKPQFQYDSIPLGESTNNPMVDCIWDFFVGISFIVLHLRATNRRLAATLRRSIRCPFCLSRVRCRILRGCPSLCVILVCFTVCCAIVYYPVLANITVVAWRSVLRYGVGAVVKLIKKP